MFGQIGPTGWKVGGHFGQKCPKSETFVRTKIGGFGEFWDQTFNNVIYRDYHGKGCMHHRDGPRRVVVGFRDIPRGSFVRVTLSLSTHETR